MGSGVACTGLDKLVVRTVVDELKINVEPHTHTLFMQLGPGVCAGFEEEPTDKLVGNGDVLLSSEKPNF